MEKPTLFPEFFFHYLPGIGSQERFLSLHRPGRDGNLQDCHSPRVGLKNTCHKAPRSLTKIIGCLVGEFQVNERPSQKKIVRCGDLRKKTRGSLANNLCIAHSHTHVGPVVWVICKYYAILCKGLEHPSFYYPQVVMVSTPQRYQGMTVSPWPSYPLLWTSLGHSSFSIFFLYFYV